MAELVEPSSKMAEAKLPVEVALPRPKGMARVERSIARVLRGGALASGALFLASLALEGVPETGSSALAIDVLRKAAASLLLGTPVLRLVVSGVALGLRGEWRYAAYAAAVLGMLGLAVGAHFAG